MARDFINSEFIDMVYDYHFNWSDRSVPHIVGVICSFGWWFTLVFAGWLYLFKFVWG